MRWLTVCDEHICSHGALKHPQISISSGGIYNIYSRIHQGWQYMAVSSALGYPSYPPVNHIWREGQSQVEKPSWQTPVSFNSFRDTALNQLPRRLWTPWCTQHGCGDHHRLTVTVKVEPWFATANWQSCLGPKVLTLTFIIVCIYCLVFDGTKDVMFDSVNLHVTTTILHSNTECRLGRQARVQPHWPRALRIHPVSLSAGAEANGCQAMWISGAPFGPVWLLMALVGLFWPTSLSLSTFI